MDTPTLQRYRTELETTRARLIDEIHRLGRAAVEDIRAPGDISNLPTQPADGDSEGLDSKIALEKTEGRILNQVEAALGRIESGTYGRCEACGGEISAERLDALPHTPYCVECERKREAG